MKAASIFLDNMVLQAGKALPVWGSGAPGERITVRIAGQCRECRADENGNWKTVLSPMKPSKQETLKLYGEADCQTVSNVAIGEVFLAAGQSNMEFQMLFDREYQEEKQDCKGYEIRFFDVPKLSYDGQENEHDYSEMGFWRSCTSDDLKYWSAVGYYAAAKLCRDLGVPVGIIGCNWGGTTASCWMDRTHLLKHGKIWMEDYEAGLLRIENLGEYEALFRKSPVSDTGRPFENKFTMKVMPGLSQEEQEEFMKSWSADDGDGLWQIVGPLSQNRPTALYSHMLKKIAGYAVRGVFWYQGESDDCHPDIYADVLPDLIDCWRELWQEELPFFLAQLAPFERWLHCNGSAYPKIRAAQERVTKLRSAVWLISTSDCGMRYDIHPKAKRPVGERMALCALMHLYGRNVEGEAPAAYKAERSEDGIRVWFKHTGKGLVLRGDSVNALGIMSRGMELAVRETRVCGRYLDIFLQSKILDEREIRVFMATSDYYCVNLYNSTEIPAIPFVLPVFPEGTGGIKREKAE